MQMAPLKREMDTHGPLSHTPIGAPHQKNMHTPMEATAWDVDFGAPPAYAVSLRLPASVLQDLVAASAAAAAAEGGGGRVGTGGLTLAVDVPEDGAGSAVR